MSTTSSDEIENMGIQLRLLQKKIDVLKTNVKNYHIDSLSLLDVRYRNNLELQISDMIKTNKTEAVVKQLRQIKQLVGKKEQFQKLVKSIDTIIEAMNEYNALYVKFQFVQNPEMANIVTKPTILKIEPLFP